MTGKSYSLSHLLDEMIKRQDQTPTMRGAQAPPSVSITMGLAVIKALKGTDGSALPLTALARAAGMKIGPCQEAVEMLQNEGLVDIEPDDDSGNDVVKLTEKGEALS